MTAARVIIPGNGGLGDLLGPTLEVLQPPPEIVAELIADELAILADLPGQGVQLVGLGPIEAVGSVDAPGQRPQRGMDAAEVAEDDCGVGYCLLRGRHDSSSALRSGRPAALGRNRHSILDTPPRGAVHADVDGVFVSQAHSFERISRPAQASTILPKL